MLRRNTLITLSAQVGIQLIGLVTGILVARFLGPSSRGELAAIIAWVAMLAYLGNLGLPIAYAYGAAREPQRISQLLGNGILATIAQWAAIALIGWAMLPLMLSAHNDQTFRLAILYLILFVPLNLLTLYSSAIQQGLGNYRKFNIVRLCVPVSYLAMLLVLVVLDRMTVAGVLVANVFSNLVALVMAVTLLIKLAWHQGRSYGFFDLKALGRDARYGISAHLGTLQPFSGLQIDILLLTLLLSARELGLYMAALAGAAVIKAQGVALGMVVMPETAKLCDNEEQRFLLLRFAAFTLLLGGMTAAVALIWAEPLINLVYGNAYSDAASTLRVLVLASVAASLNRVLADGLRGMGRPIPATTAELASLCVGVPAIFLFTPLGGTVGASVAVGLASVVALLVTVLALCRTFSSSGNRVLCAPKPTPSSNVDGE